MIELHIAIYEGAIQKIEFLTISDLHEYLQQLERFDCVWLVTEDGENGEILITQNLQIVLDAVKNSHFNLTWNSPQKIHVQEYQSYEDAYKVAFEMREANPKCYNKTPNKIHVNKDVNPSTLNLKTIDDVIGLYQYKGEKAVELIDLTDREENKSFHHGTSIMAFQIISDLKKLKLNTKDK